MSNKRQPETPEAKQAAGGDVHPPGGGGPRATEEDLARMREALADRAYSLGLHETSVARQLGLAQLEALRSWRGLVALPRRLWQLLRRLRRGNPALQRSLSELETMADELAARFAAEGFTAADADASSRFLSVPQRAHVYTELAKRVFAADPTSACRFGAVAEALDPQPFRTLWLAFMRFDAGQLDAAMATLARYRTDAPMDPSEQAKAEQLRGLFRVRHQLPVVPAAPVVRESVDGPVLYVAASALPHHVTGYTLRTQRLLTALRARQVDVACLMRPGYPGDRPDRLPGVQPVGDIDGVPYLRAPGDRARLPLDKYLAQAAKAIADVAKARKAVLVHAASNFENGLPALLAARKLGLPFVYEVRGLWEFTAASRVPGWESSERFALERELESLVARNADQVLVLNEELAVELRRRGVSPERISMAPNGVDPGMAAPVDPALRESLGLAGADFVVGFAGSLVGYEGLDDLLRGMALLANSQPGIHALLVGDGESRAALEKLAGELGLAGRVHFAGRVAPADVARHLVLCDCVALPRKPVRVCELVEPLKPVEAMALGLPLLVSNVAPLRRLVEDGVTGRVHAAGDPASLARCLAEMAGNPDATRRLGSEARRVMAAERSWEGVAAKVAAVYRGLPASGSSGDSHAGPRPAAPDRLRDLRVVAIMDEFTQACFEPECQLTPLSLADWRAQVDSVRPHLLLVESAWHGLRSEWEKKVPQCSDDLRELVSYCRSKGIPTAFWNKEDPVHYALFLRTAALFDVVFTTDMDRLKSYRQDLGHARVHLLPFAAQPRVHNPVERYDRKDAFCFAGSYYAKYPERRADFDLLVEAASALRPVEIYDRNHGKDDPGLAFPEKYQPLVQGSLPFTAIDRAYKGYRYAITINTVKQSQSMFARRAFELLACNTLTISNYSRGLRALLGDLVPSAGDARRLREVLQPLLDDESAMRRFRLAGLRKVMSEHTYGHRLAWLASHALGEGIAPAAARVVVVARVSDQAGVDAALAGHDAQQWPDKSLVLVAAEGFLPAMPAGRRDLSVLGEAQSRTLFPAEAWPGAWVAVLDPRDHYGPAYLTDLALVARYAEVDFAAKSACFRWTDGGPVLVEDGSQYRPAAACPMRRSLVRTEALAGQALASLLDGDTLVPAASGLAIDEFNYCEGGRGRDVAGAVDDLAVDAGHPMDELLARSEIRGHAAAPVVSGIEAPAYGLEALRVLFPPSSHVEGKLKVVHAGDDVEVHSRLDEGKHGYVYASRWFSAGELAKDGFARFHLRTSAGLYVNAALVFFDAARERISHAIVSSDTNQAIPLPAGTEWIRFGLRVLGAGETRLLSLVRGAVAPHIDQIMGRGQALLITKDYPRYDNLYRYGFVHRRVLAYSAEGLRVDVFRFSNQALCFDEFQGVDVVAGQEEHLRLMLEGHDYAAILVHAMDVPTWEAVKPLLDRYRVIVWVHGAEIQPWYRRSFNLGTAAEQDKARRAGEKRRRMWMDVLAHPHPNLRVVFVSRYLAHEALKDLGLSLPPGQFTLIPNFVDGDLFQWRPKPAAQRLRVLSIRPYASAVYGNDLAVQAIVSLSKEPWFDELEFLLVGDGPLFEETVAPLRGLANVRLEQGFVSQARIAELHRDHGVFLVPTRMDSQGVSRDEAMASGLVPVTNRVAAVPEFVDEQCAWLAEAEDAEGLAEGIRRLRAEPEMFLRMSEAAARQARRLSGYDATIRRELALVQGQPSVPVVLDVGPVHRRIAIYGDVNLNITDGSAIWAASLAQVLGGAPGVRTTLYLKARVKQTHIIAPLLPIQHLRLAEPDIATNQALSPDEALDRIEADHQHAPYDAIVLRGFDLCERAAARGALRGRLWIYITDLPQRREDLGDAELERLRLIADAAGVILCQTRQFETYLLSLLPEAKGKTRLLPPMIPDLGPAGQAPRHDGPLRLGYAGKFAPLWGIREMFASVATLRDDGVPIELHAFGDKIHNPADDPAFRDEVRTALSAGEGVSWHGAMEREALLEQLRRMDVGWAWRHASLEEHTHELSTKLLEYAACGVPPIMVANAVNRDVFGPDYPLYAGSEDDARALLRRLATEPDLLAQARARVETVAAGFTFDAVRSRLAAQGLLGPADLDAARG
ncbi:glycosyltransferase [Arenimonas aestuarii]